ncbi:HAD family hydrolase [bacterium]|nr:HAD family hydrolase [bacterium]
MAIKIIAFDADDTLWDNEPYFRETERKFCEMLEDFLPQHSVSRELLQTEIKDIPLYGFGIKSFMLSMIETAIRISDGNIRIAAIEKILRLGQEQMQLPVHLIDGVEDVLKALQPRYRLVMATKGDLVDQERKLKKSSLAGYFHHIEIMSDKKEADFKKLIDHLDISPDELMMIGNSLKSDIMPVLNLGGHGIHVPYHVTWEHEKVDAMIDHAHFRQVESIKDVLQFL